tara:strand:- start:29 stop:523 length:495 start_codon:yes stop_codon:yes gene_type:complete
MIKHLPLLLFIGLAWGQEDLVIKKAESSIKFKNGQKLIIRYTNVESNVVLITEGEFKSVDNDFLMISTENVIAEKISLPSITKITVPSKIPANISFIKGSCSGAGIGLILIGIMAFDDPLNSIAAPGFAMVGAFLGGLASYIAPKFRKTKGYLIQNDEWKIVND